MNILNRYGHTCSYNTVEELETELAYESSKSRRALPQGMSTDASLATGLAFDNYDRFVETLDGGCTMHDTVGICYQVEQRQAELENAENISSPEMTTVTTSAITTASNMIPTASSSELPVGTSSKKQGKRRRLYDAPSKSIEPYRKKPKMTKKVFFLLKTNEENMFLKQNIRQRKKI